MTTRHEGPGASPDETPELAPAESEAAEETTQEAPSVADAAPQLAELQERYLRLAAEFDNFRKRTARERTETWARAQADVVGRLVEPLDDLARSVAVDPAQTDVRTLHEGVAIVERKLWKALDVLGVRRIDAVDVPFDPNEHEAMTLEPAATPEQDQTVGAVLAAGYKLGDLLIRPARVVVRRWDRDAAPEE